MTKKRGISNEQVCVLVARDRTKQALSQVVTFGRLDAATLDQVLTSSLKPGVILCTDEEPAFRKYCREQKLQHEKVNPASLGTHGWNYGIKVLGAGRTAMFLNGMPFSNMFGGFIFLGENIRSIQLCIATLFFRNKKQNKQSSLIFERIACFVC